MKLVPFAGQEFKKAAKTKAAVEKLAPIKVAYVPPPPSPLAEWGKIFRELRTENGLSQHQVSHGAKINRSTLRRIEEGRACGHLDVVERLARYFGYELDIVPSGEKVKHLAPADVSSKDAVRRLLKLSPADMR